MSSLSCSPVDGATSSREDCANSRNTSHASDEALKYSIRLTSSVVYDVEQVNKVGIRVVREPIMTAC